MRKQTQDKESPMSSNINSHHTHPGRVWGILHLIKYHHWRHVKRRFTPGRHSGGRREGNEIPGTSDDTSDDNMSVLVRPDSPLSNEKQLHSTPNAKHSIKSKIKALLHEDTYKKKSRHKRSSTCPAKSQLTRVDSVHHLEVDPLSEMLLTAESHDPVIETFQNHLAAGTLDVLSPVFSGKHVTTNNNEKCVDCGTLFSSETLEHDRNHMHHNLSSSSTEGLPEEKSMNAKILTTDASPHLFRDFLDALDVINTNKDFLLKYIHDPGSPIPFYTHNQKSPGGKSRRSNSISFPICGSSSGTKDSEQSQQHIDKVVGDLFNTKGDTQMQSHSLNHLQNVSMSQPSKDFHSQSIPSHSSHKVDQFHYPDQEWLQREYNISSPSSHVPTHTKTKNFKDLRKKLKHIIEESKNEKHRIAMDGIIDKVPRGNKFSNNVKKLIRESKSFNPRQNKMSNMRTSSLKESANKYSQLYETCCNNEVKHPKTETKTESLRLNTEERSSVLKTPKSFKRFLSLPNFKSYSQQGEEPSVLFSPQNSIRNYEDRFGHGEDSKSPILSPTLTDKTNQKEVLMRSSSELGSDVNDEKKEDNKSIGVDGLENLRDSEGAACNEQDIGSTTDASTVLVRANSAFSSDTSFLDGTFELENLNVLEELDSELKPAGAAYDGLYNITDQQEEAKMDQSEVFENIEKLQKLRSTLSNSFNYENPYIEVDASNEAAFNYVRKVLELSGFTNQESLGLWYSDDQPLDPSIYEELEGCLLLDPDCSGNCDEGGHCNHLLLFDIINEGLLEIFGRSYNYYPRPLSSLSHVHPLPAGANVLHKVWKLISWYLNSTCDEIYPSLDYYVSKDLAKNDEWMNLQFDSECVGLELDDLIFGDLLQEIICT